MDFYANDSLGAWTNNNEAHRPVRQRKTRPVKIEIKPDNHSASPGSLQAEKLQNSSADVCLDKQDSVVDNSISDKNTDDLRKVLKPCSANSCCKAEDTKCCANNT
jgi:hypothetical protein